MLFFDAWLWLTQGQYLVHGEHEGALSESGGGGGDYHSEKQSHHHQHHAPQQRETHLRSSRGQLRGGGGVGGGTSRGLSRQDTFDSETQGSRDSAYTEAGDSCMDIETDPYEEPEPYRGGGGGGGGSRLHLSQHHAPPRQASWEDEGAEPDQENLNRPSQPPPQATHHHQAHPGRPKLRERYCQEDTNTGRNKNQEQDWDRDVYIR